MNNSKIISNTIMLYIRQIITILIGLYTVRIVLNVLGETDYGIYGVVGGIVSLFSFLSATMASATQRFFSIALGENNDEKLKATFSVNCVIYCGIAIVAVVLLETFGLWYLSNLLNIPSHRLEAAKILYHFSVVNFTATILMCPFMAIIIAHEDMRVYAYFSLIEAGMKFFITYILRVFSGDKLQGYGFLLACIGICNFGMYFVYCIRKYSECQFKKNYWDKNLFKETLNFTGWTLFGQMTTVVRNQAVTILVNQYFNPIVVSARTIAVNVSNYINIFANSFNTGLYPSIIKSYAIEDKKRMFSLVNIGSKVSFFLVWIFALPLFIKMDFVLQIWLGKPPESAVLFTRLALFEVIVNSMSLPVATVARAPGKMKMYELPLGIMQLIIFLLDYILLEYFTMQAFVVFCVAAIISLVMCVIRLLVVKHLVGLELKKYIMDAILPMAPVVVISVSISYVLDVFLSDSFVNTTIFCVLSCFGSLLTIYVFGINKIEKMLLWNIINKKINSKRNKI